MKIKVSDKIAVEVKIAKTYQAPSGNSNYTISYLIDNICIHNATTGVISGEPNPIAMLDREFSVSEYHYQDVDNPDPIPVPRPKNFCTGTSSGRPCWWLETKKTHRQAIIEAVDQIVE